MAAELRSSGKARTIRLLVVNDKVRIDQLGGRNATEQHTISVVNLVSAWYARTTFAVPLRVVLSGQVMLEQGDPYQVSPASGNSREVAVQGNGGLLTNFLDWSGEVKLPDHDSHQLFSGHRFEYPVLGLAGVSQMCKGRNSGSVTQITLPTLVENAVISAHELGHTIGMWHDSTGNQCPQSGFIMAAVAGVGEEFSQCSLSYFRKFMEEQPDCMPAMPIDATPDSPKPVEPEPQRPDQPAQPETPEVPPQPESPENPKPSQPDTPATPDSPDAKPPQCGDGVVQPGEECDCGKDDCLDTDDYCCDGSTCTYYKWSFCSRRKLVRRLFV